ncbi:DUF3501 family protein [Gammaproteobacteria bacterium]|nr:DUF3501 family protein [Gammaproteobacteria bacterium]
MNKSLDSFKLFVMYVLFLQQPSLRYLPLKQYLKKLMTELKIEDLLSADEYDKKRDELLSIANSESELRTVRIGNNVSLLFENKETVQSKLQELLRNENVIQSEKIQKELSVYQLLLPDTNSLKASMSINSDEEEKKGIDKRVWIQIGENDRVFGSSSTNLNQIDDEDDQGVFVLEFDLSNLMVKDFQLGMILYAGIDHPKYNIRTKEILKQTTASLAKGLL